MLHPIPPTSAHAVRHHRKIGDTGNYQVKELQCHAQRLQAHGYSSRYRAASISPQSRSRLHAHDHAPFGGLGKAEGVTMAPMTRHARRTWTIHSVHAHRAAVIPARHPPALSSVDSAVDRL